MKNLETNKIVAAILVAGLIALITGKVAEVLYKPGHGEGSEEKRGFSIAVEEAPTEAGKGAKKDEPIDIGALLAAADAAAGEKEFKKCASCHTSDKGGPDRIGPNLAGIVGGKKAHSATFAYSDPLKAKGGTWTYEDLFAFFKKPKDFVPGTKMTFAGLSNPKDIANVIAYLRTTGGNPPPLPKPAK
jgi:cytochrome c